MNIGGVDVVLRVEHDISVAEIILHIARRLWHRCVFQDAEQSQVLDIDDPKVWLYGPASREFFVYRDREAANAWSHEGGTPPNQQTMMHFLVGGDELTVVVGDLTGEMVPFIEDLKRAVHPKKRILKYLVAA